MVYRHPVMQQTTNQREQTIARLVEQPLDVLVIGGGIVGAGVARDAAMRGLRTGLVEQHDFASGTSSRSSRPWKPARSSHGDAPSPPPSAVGGAAVPSTAPQSGRGRSTKRSAGQRAASCATAARGVSPVVKNP